MIKQIIKDGSTDQLPENAISIRQLNAARIIACASADHIGILVYVPCRTYGNDGKWYFHALYSAQDYWGDSIKDTPGESARHMIEFAAVYQFDTILEFSEWSEEWAKSRSL